MSRPDPATPAPRPGPLAALTTLEDIAGYRVWHAPMRPTRGRVRRARYDVLEQAGLVTPGQTPHSVLLERRSDFVVYLPPTLLDAPLPG